MIYEKQGYYHIYNRGNNKQPIFFENTNYEYLTQILNRNAQKYEIAVIAYCLMPNHFHLLLRQDSEKSIRDFLRSSFQSYVQAINKRYRRTGRLFESHPKHKTIDDIDYLLHLCRYIHINPVKANIVQNPEQWQYSNYLEFIGKRESDFFDCVLFNEWFDSGHSYQSFVHDFIEKETQVDFRIRKFLFEE